jgi:two-component system response regulator YesN
MYRVLIVDDDIVIRHDLSALIDWPEYGYTVAAEADNGLAALDVLRSGDIDLVVTDIYMPVMDGVELIRRAKEEFGGVEFIVISNYDEFKYVKDAMKYGAFDYLLKYEIDPSGFIPVITAVRRILDGKRRSLRANMENSGDWRLMLEEKFWRNALTSPPDLLELQTESGKLGIEIHSAPFVLFLLNANHPAGCDHLPPRLLKELDGSLPSLAGECAEMFKYRRVLRMEESLWAIVLKPGEISQSVVKNSCFLFSKDLLRRIKQKFDLHIVLVMSEVILKAENFPEAYGKMREALDYKFYFGPDTFIDMSYIRAFADKYEGSGLETLRQGMLENIGQLNFELARQQLASIAEAIRNAKLNPGLVYEYFSALLLSMRELLEARGVPAHSPDGIAGGQRIRSLKTLKQLEAYVQEQMNGAEAASRGIKDTPCRLEVRKALGYIRNNYMKNLSLESVSSYAGVSKNYLCKLFKEETGENFVEYLNKYRIEKAKGLISGSNKSMKEVASLVGLDYAYFCKVFRNTVGKKPSDLR